MYYHRIKLKDYERFALNNISEFEMTMSSALQLILGTNGCGKSSLMYQISPLPAHPRDFGKTGGKVVEFTHRDRHYVLTSDFANKTQPHSFVVDGQEQNEGGTISVQLGKVKEYFGITPEIHDLLLGRKLFTAMSPPERKEWFLKLCVTNYDYAIWLWKKAKELSRDTAGALKLAKKTLVQESEKLIGDDALDKLRAEADMFHCALNGLLEFRKPVEGDLDVLDIKQSQLDRTLTNLTTTLQQLHATVDGHLTTVAEYDPLIADAQEQITRATAVLDQLSAEYKKNDDKIRLLQKAEAKSVEILGQEIDAISTQLTQLLTSSLVAEHYPLGLPDPRSALIAFESLRHPLSDIFSEIPSNEDRQYSSQALEAAKTRIQELQQALTLQREALERTRVGLQHQEAHRDKPDLACPKCNHRFSAQYDAQRYAELKLDEAERLRLINEVYTPELGKLATYQQECAAYAVLYRQYVQLTNNATLLDPYWTLWSQQELLRLNPKSGIHAIQAVHGDLQKQVEAFALNGQLKERLELRQALQSLGSADLQSLLQTNRGLEEQLGQLTAALQKATSLKAGYQHAQQRLRQYLELHGKIMAVIQQKRTLNKETLETIRRQEFNAFIRTLQSALAQVEQQIGTAAQQKHIVDNLTKRIDEYVLQEEAASALVKELSPTEGLIAEGLLGFIKNYVEQMNTIIAALWSYPMEVQSCDAVGSDTVDLDYLFPVKVPNTEPRKDVKDGSSGMLEVINLAFRMVAMQYLHLQDSPLFLDEAGQTLDAKHKAETVTLIKNLIEQQTFSQVFLISHDFVQYGALSNCQICLINGLNVAAPSGNAVNQHVRMT